MKRKYQGGVYRRHKARRLIAGAAGGIVGYTLGNLPGAYAGARLGYAAAGGYKKRSIVSDGTTVQRDDKITYRKKRMPKKKRKAWKKFTKKVNAVEIKDRGLQVQKFYYGFNGATVSAQTQARAVFHLYGTANTQANTGTETGNMDMALLRTEANLRQQNWIKQIGGVPNPTIPGGLLTPEIRMQSAILDCTIQNSGNVPLIVDIYHVWYTKANNYKSFGDCLASWNNEHIPLQTGSTSAIADETKLRLDQLDTKLFDLPQLISLTGLTVKSVREVYLTPGQVHKVGIRDAKNYSINPGRYGLNISDQVGYADPKLTESYILVFKNYGTSDGQYNMWGTRTYRYTVEGVKTFQDGTVNAQ